MTDVASDQHLRTRFVFVDTEALRKARFDWTGRTLSKLSEFAKHGHLQLLVTDVTIGEVKSQLRELLLEATTSIRKHQGVLQQLGAADVLAAVGDESGAVATLETAFEKFLKDGKSINVPLNADISALVGDYFSRRPPFSAKKKSEFPDAIVIASLLAWCEKKRVMAYVVSGDPDLEACCTPSGPLLHAASVEAIISQATVSKELHEALAEALNESDALWEELKRLVKGMDVVGSRTPWTIRSGYVDVDARIDDVEELTILSVNVLDQDDNTFTCELELQVGLVLNLHVRHDSHNYDREYGPSFYDLHKTIYHYPYAEVLARFDPKNPEKIDFESIHVSGDPIELRSDHIDERWFR